MRKFLYFAQEKTKHSAQNFKKDENTREKTSWIG
jgi:hypothetical protein